MSNINPTDGQPAQLVDADLPAAEMVRTERGTSTAKPPTNEEMLMWAPVPTDVTSPEIRARIEAAASDIEMVEMVVTWFVNRHRGLHDAVTAEADAACPRGVPNDYHWQVMRHNGWNDSVEDALTEALRPLDEIVPDGRMWPQ